MNGVRIYVSNDINNTDTILNGEAIDLFKDENIQITLKQTDIRDIATNYTDFTQDFTVPASPKNNRIFRYWYDYNNDNQFESVSGIPCRIDIDGVFFKKGVLKINSAQIDDNGQIKHYSVQFTANLKALKDKFDDTKISGLNFSNIVPVEIPSTDDCVISSIMGTTSSTSFMFPIVSTTRLLNDFNTIKYINSSTLNGITKNELRPAIKVKHIFEAIEDNYDVKFTGGFYDTNSPLDKMYLWLNKNETQFSNVLKLINLNGSTYSNAIATFPVSPPSPYIQFNTTYDYFSIIKRNNVYYWGVTVILNVSNNTVPYRVYIQQIVTNSDGTVDEASTRSQDNDGFLFTSDFYTGNRSIHFGFNANSIPLNEKRNYRVYMEAAGNITLNHSSVRPQFRSYPYPYVQTASIMTNSGATVFAPMINVNNSLPEISIYDFFSSIIKMFNLVTIPISDPVILNQLQSANVFQIEYFNKYYGKLAEIDITDYTKKAIKINKIKTYKKFELKHADSSYGTSILFKNSQTPAREYGSIKTTFNKGDDGEFKIETKLGLLIWRKLPNTYGDDDDYQLNETWIIADGLDEQFDKGVFDKPTIFFSNGTASLPSTKTVAFTKENSTSIPLTTYNIFSNVDKLDIFNYNTTLTFSREYEFQTDLREKTLFSNNYEDLLSGIYSPYTREYEVSAILPKHIYTNLNLGSQLIIRNQRFNITDINLNLINGETKLKLNNVIEESNIIETELSGSSTFSIDTISNTYYPASDLTEKVIQINYPVNTASLKWRANYTIVSTASGNKVSFSTTDATGFGGLLWFDFYQPSGSSIGNHTTSLNQFVPVGTYMYDTATSYTSPITGYIRAKTGNSLTINVVAYDIDGNTLAQGSVTV